MIIYGAGIHGQLVLDFLCAEGLKQEISAFCDRKYIEYDGFLQDIPVYPIEYIKEDCNEEFVVAAGDSATEEICKMLSGRRVFRNLDEWLRVKSEENPKRITPFLIEKWNEILEISDDEKLLKEAYAKDNYLEIDSHTEKDICYIFFSSNALYFPNTKIVFKDLILRRDRYEWQHISENDFISNVAGKYIFIRDIYKSWYIEGINKRINSIDKLIDFLIDRTKGYRVRTVGASAGGYMASLVGAKIGAEVVFNFAGQFVLDRGPDLTGNYYYLRKNKNDSSKNKYFNIVSYIKDTVPIMYFYGYGSKQDFMQKEEVKNIENVFCFAFDTDKHGVVLEEKDIPIVLTLKMEHLKKLYVNHEAKIIDKTRFIIK